MNTNVITDEQYLLQAQRDKDSFLYKKLCRSGPVVSFRLLLERSFTVDNIILHKIEPTATIWETATGNSTNTTANTLATRKRNLSTASSSIAAAATVDGSASKRLKHN